MITVTIGEAARRLRVSRQTVRRLIISGDLVAERTRSPEEYTKDRHGREIRGHWRITESSLAAYEAERDREKNLENVPR